MSLIATAMRALGGEIQFHFKKKKKKTELSAISSEKMELCDAICAMEGDRQLVASGLLSTWYEHQRYAG